MMVKQLIYDSCMIVEKGTEVHRGRGFASKSFKPSASADGKREDDGLWGLLILIAIFI